MSRCTLLWWWKENYHGEVSKMILRVNQILWELWNSAQPTNGMTLDYVIMWQVKNFIVQLSRRLQWSNVVEIRIKMKHFLSSMSLDMSSWLVDILKLRSATYKKTATTKLGGNASQSYMVLLLHVAWANHAKYSNLQHLKLH